MLTLIALSAVLMQDPPAPPAPPEARSSFMIMDVDGRGSLDKDGDGQVSRDEFAAPMNDHFGRMDKDGDGRLSTEELAVGHRAGAVREMLINRGPGGEGEPHVRRIEMGRPGAGGAREVFISRAPGGDGPGVSHFEMRRPLDGDEASVVVRERAHGPGARIIRRSFENGADPDSRVEVRMFDRDGAGHDMDSDNDGRVSEAEFTQVLRDAFGRMDADRSGFLEEGERGRGDDVRVFTHRLETRPGGDD